MTAVHKPLTGTQSDGEVVSATSYHVVLETSPPDYVEKISRYLESSVGQGRQDKASNGPAAAESDSGDSLFITQKVTLPDAVRSGPPRYYSRRSNPISPRDIEESDGGSSSTSQDGELKTPIWRRRKKYSLSKYSFPFLEEQECKRKSTLLPNQNKSLHNYMLGGFFKCLRELRQSYQTGQTLESSLPTLDMDGGHISPLSEEDGEMPEAEDIKVVERKHFLASFKTKSQQTWCNKGGRKDNASGRRQTEMLHEKRSKPAIMKLMPKSLDIKSSGNKGSSCRVIVQRGREASKPVAGQASDGPGSQRLLHRLPDRTSITKVNKRKIEGSEGPRAATSVNLEVEETPSLPQGYRAVQTSDVLELSGKKGTGDSSGDDNALNRVEGDIPHSKQKNKSAAESVRQEVDGNLECNVRVEDSVSSVSRDVEDGGKKKKNKRRKSSVEDVEQLQSGVVAEPLSDDAEMMKKKKKKKKRTKSSGENVEQLQSSVVAEPLSDDAEIQTKKKKRRRKSSGEDVEQLQSGVVTEPLSDDAEMMKKKKKKKKKKKRRKSSGYDAEQLQSSVVAEPLSDDAEIQMKKKKRRRKSSGEDVEQLRSSVVAEPLSEDVEMKKKKKKRSKSSGEDVEQLQSSVVAEPLSDDAELQKKKQKKKKRKKELGIVIEEEHEEEEASNRTLDLPSVSTEQLEASGNCLENAAALHEPLGTSVVKRKKHKKKKQSFSNDATQAEEEDVSFCLDDSVTLAKGSGASRKKRRKTIFEEMNVSYAPKENRKFENVSNQKTNEGLEDQNAELATKKKKKKKKSEIFSRGVSEDKVSQSDDSVSAREKEKKRHTSFLVADEEESDAQTHGERISPSRSRVGAGDVEELNDGVTKQKKKKRKMSIGEDSMKRGRERDCGEPDETRRSTLPESADAGRKRKKERMGSENEGLDSAAEAGFSANDEAVLLKEKKKKCNDVIIEGPPTATTCSSVSRKKKGQRGRSAEVSHDAGTYVLTSVEHDLASSETLNDTRDPKKKKKKLKNEGTSLTESVELEPRETKKRHKKERSEQPPVPNDALGSLVTPETSDILRKKHRKLKQKLYNPNQGFFPDY